MHLDNAHPAPHSRATPIQVVAAPAHLADDGIMPVRQHSARQTAVGDLASERNNRAPAKRGQRALRAG
ncbi:MAG TPA: hypothetical protein VGK19_17130 [Capsulimonadaceae bacterium]